MFLKALPVIIGISILSGVSSSILLSETKYYGTHYNHYPKIPMEISESDYNKTEFYNEYKDLHYKKKLNYELGALTAVSVFAGLLILNGLRKGKKPTPEN